MKLTILRAYRVTRDILHIKMHISEATVYLAEFLRDHLKAVSLGDPAIRFLTQVARIREFRDQGNLDAWETAVLSVFTDIEWEEFERRADFKVFEDVWEVGRMNMYRAIDEAETQRFYREAAKAVFDLTGRLPIGESSFDLSE